MASAPERGAGLLARSLMGQDAVRSFLENAVASGRLGQVEQVGELAADAPPHLGDAAARVDDADPPRLGAGDLEEPGAHAVLERGALALHAVGPFAHGAAERLAGLQVEQQGSVGGQAAAGDGVDRAHRVAAEAPREALVGVGRVEEAVADDDGPAVEGRAHDLCDELGARRLEEEQLAGRVHRLGLGVEQERADALAQGGAAGLAQADHLVPRRAQGVAQKRALGGLARAVDPLERHEHAAARVGVQGAAVHGRGPSLVRCRGRARHARCRMKATV